MKRAIRFAALIVFLTLAMYVGWLSLQVAEQAGREEARAADVILVLGAAEYHGRPSPVLKARLDHALELYQRGIAPRIMTTGGAGGDPVFTEGGVGRSYLMSQGVPSEAIIVESESASTVSSTAMSAEIIHRMGLHSVIVVTDGYHVFRVKRMLESQGLEVYGSPRKDLHPDGLHDRWNYFRQAAGYLLWRAGLAT